MVDPSKDQLYQQRLWGHLGAYGGHPSLLAPTSSASASTLPIPPPHIYDSSRLHPHFAGLVPNPSPGPPPPSAPPSTASYKEPSIPAYGGHYTHLAALSAAVAASDYSRPLPAHGQEASAASVGAPLPAHLQSRHPAAYPPTQAYHDAYANYYNQRVGRNSEPLRQPAHNGFDVAYGGHIQQQAHHQVATAGVTHKPPDHERNGYKGVSNPTFPPYGYPPTNGPVQQQPSYHYPFDVTKIGYHNQHYANQHQPHQAQPGQTSDASRGAKPTPLHQPLPPTPSQQQAVQPRQNSATGQTAPTASSAHNAHIAHTPKNNGIDAPVNLAGRHSSLPPSAALAALHYPNSKQSLNSAPPQSQQHFPQNSSLYPTLPKKMSSPSLGPLESALRGISGGSENEPLKRRPSDNLLPDQPEQKKPKPMVVGDPYKFDDDIKSEEKALELTRFGSTGSSIKSETPPPPPASSSPSLAGIANGSNSNTVYKFKSALLSRNCNVELPKLSSKSVPLTFEGVQSLSIFVDACDRFMEDMNSKPVSVSRRASLESFVAAQAAKAARKAERKAEKEQQKAEAAERKAEREERKEKERLGLLPPQEKSPKKRKKGKKTEENEEAEEEDKSNHVSGSGSAEDLLVKENEDPSSREIVPHTNNNHNPPSIDDKPKKPGGTWALPIVPKMPQKPGTEKRKGLAPLPNLPIGKAKKAHDKSNSGGKSNQGLTNVWLQAFGAKPSATGAGGNATNGQGGKTLVKQEQAVPEGPTEKLREPASKKTYLDIPPEKRRRPKPNFGGLIHFSPDWERAVQRHHEKSRMPQPLIDNIRVKPHILNSSNSQLPAGPPQPPPPPPPAPVSSLTTDTETKEDSNRYAALSSYLGSPTHTSDHGSPPPPPPSSLYLKDGKSSPYPYLTVKGSAAAAAVSDASDGIASVVDSILQHRKKLRQSFMGRMFKVPFMKEKKKRVREEAPLETIKLMPTPGLPEIKDDLANDDNVMKSFNNFRRLTLLRYLDGSGTHSPELKAKILDWKPEVLSSKTRHQTSKAREVTAYKEIFGTELPGKSKKTKSSKKKKKVDPELSSDSATTTPTKQTPEKPKKSTKKAKKVEEATPPITPLKNAPPPPPATEESDENEEVSEAAQELQTELQSYALDLLDTNASWEKRKVIQNLVIWEPVTDPALLALPPDVAVPGTVTGASLPINLQSTNLSGRKKAKKVRKRQSGLDFSRKTKGGSKGSRDTSRAHSPLEDRVDAASGGNHEITHTLDNVLNDTKHMVMDKSAGETILHRASKMGYPDVAAYALDMIKMNPTIKDNAGFPPIHKAALKGHAEVVDYLIRYGADPNTNVKGTRPLHEALEGGHIEAVARLLRHGSDPLLYDYSGNMPIDLARESEVPELLEFFSAILGDLHGKTASRWNVNHDRAFVIPQEEALDLPDNDPAGDAEENDPIFEVSSQPLPPEFILSQRPKERFILNTDLKKFTTTDINKKKCEVLELTREEFIKSAYSCLVGTQVDIVKADPVILIKVDPAVRKMLGIDEPKLFNHSSPSKKGNKHTL